MRATIEEVRRQADESKRGTVLYGYSRLIPPLRDIDRAVRRKWTWRWRQGVTSWRRAGWRGQCPVKRPRMGSSANARIIYPPKMNTLELQRFHC